MEIEHRYFGISMPGNGSYTYNNQDSWPNSFMAPLTFENILLDSVTLVSWIKSTVPGVNESKVVVVGGSYGGFLSYSLRQHYPQIFYGSIASSAPVNGIVSDPKGPYALAIGDYVSYPDRGLEELRG